MADGFDAALGRGRGSSRPRIQVAPEQDRVAAAVADSETLPGVFANPGAGELATYADGHAGDLAAAAVAQLIADCERPFTVRRPDAPADADGRYEFELAFSGRTVGVLMPGLPTDAVRFDRET